MTINWTAFGEMVSNHERFLLTSHMRPDCDALGSELGMAGLLEALGKDVRIVNPEPTPPNLAFIDPDRRLEAIGVDVSLEDLADREVVMVLDTSAWAQLGDMATVIRALKAKKCIFDHHMGEDDLDAELFKDRTAEATGRLVVDAAESLNVPLNAKMAMPLFAAVATDTGWFRFPSAKASTYRCGAKLIQAGADPSYLYQALYEQDTLGRMRLRGVVLARIRSDVGGRLAHTFVRLSDFTETGAVSSDTEDLINLALSILGTEVAVILVELPGGQFKVSFRSRCDVDCSQLARGFGGGGHKAAAGATLVGTFEEVQPRVLDAVRAAMQ
jgi:bifunctional oligoribonuclease and PAP phosphatase NrnA